MTLNCLLTVAICTGLAPGSALMSVPLIVASSIVRLGFLRPVPLFHCFSFQSLSSAFPVPGPAKQFCSHTRQKTFCYHFLTLRSSCVMSQYRCRQLLTRCSAYRFEKHSASSFTVRFWLHRPAGCFRPRVYGRAGGRFKTLRCCFPVGFCIR